LLTFEAANLGFPFMLIRLVLSIIGIIAIATVSQKSLNVAGGLPQARGAD
jgi:hypothetical protein